MTVRWSALSTARINRLVLDREAVYRSTEAGVPVAIEQPAIIPVPASDWSDS